MFQNFLQVFPNSSLIFFKILTNITEDEYLFLTFAVHPRQFLSPLLKFYRVFCKFLKFFFKDILWVSIKFQLKFAQIFILVLLKNFLASFLSDLKFFLTFELFFSINSLSVISSVLIFFILCFVTLFTKNPHFSKFVLKFQKFYLKLFQT